jgi:hypothetical protein
MNAHVDVQARLHAFLTLLLGNAERGGSRLGRSTPRETAPLTRRGWVGLRAGPDTLEKRSASLLRLQPNNFARTVQSVGQSLCRLNYPRSGTWPVRNYKPVILQSLRPVVTLTGNVIRDNCEEVTNN